MFSLATTPGNVLVTPRTSSTGTRSSGLAAPVTSRLALGLSIAAS